MKRPWMPLYIADYLADTTHLTTTQHGAYLLLIMHYWTNGKLPEDEGAIRRITGLDARNWKRSRPMLKSLFGGKVEQWSHQRIDMELAQVIEISEKRSAIAKKRHAAQANRQAPVTLTVSKAASEQPIDLFNDAPTLAVQLHTHSHSHSHIDKKESISVGRKTTRPRAGYSEKFEEFWKAYPKRSGSNPKAPAEKRFSAAVAAGVSPDVLIASAMRYAVEIRAQGKERTEFVAQAQNWLSPGQRRWEQYEPANIAAESVVDEPVWKKPPPEFMERQHAKSGTPDGRDTGLVQKRPGHLPELQLPSRKLLRPQVQRAEPRASDDNDSFFGVPAMGVVF